MATYQYKARDKFGKLLTGVMTAESENAVVIKLSQSACVPVAIKQVMEKSWVQYISRLFVKVGFAELNIFTRQLATLQKAGLPILMSLGALKEQTQNNAFKDVISQIIRDIESGLSFSGALQKFPEIFNDLYINMIASGEAGGSLDETLEKLAALGEYDERLRMRVKAATRYPVIVVGAMVVGFFILTTLVVPRYTQIYGQFSAKLPLPTVILIVTNHVVRHYWGLLFLCAGGLVGGFRAFVRTSRGRFFWDGLKLKVPVFGPLLLKMAMARFTRVTGTLMRSGLSLLSILDIAAHSTGNVVVSEIILRIKASVVEGKGMSEPMKMSGFFPPIVTQMVSVGEQTGKLDALLIHVSGYYDEQVDFTISNLTSLIEPLLIFVLGCGVLLMALGIFLPMWNLMSLFSKR